MFTTQLMIGKSLCIWVNILFCAPQVLGMMTRTLCTQRTTVSCLVQTTSRSSPIGPHTSKHWCCSFAQNNSSFLQFAFLLIFSIFLPAVCVMSWPLKIRNQIALWVSRAVIPSAEHAEMKILFQAKLSSVIINWVHYGSVPQTYWHDTKLSPQLTL